MRQGALISYGSLALLVGLLTACGNGSKFTPPAARDESPDKRSDSADSRVEKTDTQKSESESQPVISSSPTPSPGSSPAAQETEEVSYPLLEYTAFGLLQHTRRDRPYQIQRQVKLTPSQQFLNVSVVRFTSNDGNVRDQIESKIGETQYVRASKEELAAAKDARGQPLKILPFGIYAKSVNVKLDDQTHNSFQFATPIPVYIVPGSLSRFEELKNGPVTVSTRVTGKIGRQGSTTVTDVSFNLNLRFTLSTGIISSVLNPGSFKVTVDASIPEDDSAAVEEDQGALYGAFPIDKKSIYSIDGGSKKIVEIETTGEFNDDDARQRMTFSYKICKETLRGILANFTCPTDYPEIP
jgi:hypothetical protein